MRDTMATFKQKATFRTNNVLYQCQPYYATALTCHFTIHTKLKRHATSPESAQCSQRANAIVSHKFSNIVSNGQYKIQKTASLARIVRVLHAIANY